MTHYPSIGSAGPKGWDTAGQALLTLPSSEGSTSHHSVQTDRRTILPAAVSPHLGIHVAGLSMAT